MAFQSAQEQIPILCSRCGGRAEAQENWHLKCGFCGHQEQLPSDALERSIVLKDRLKRWRGSVAQLRGAEANLAQLFESPRAFLRVEAVLTAVLVLVGLQSFLQLRDLLPRTPPAFHAGFIVQGLMSVFFIGGIVVAVALALAVGRMNYRRTVRPLLSARAAKADGLPARCRVCGADLPGENGPFIVCRFCQTHNLLTRELQTNRSGLLEAEERFYREAAARLAVATSKPVAQMSRTIWLSVAIVYALVIVGFAISQRLFPRA